MSTSGSNEQQFGDHFLFLSFYSVSVVCQAGWLIYGSKVLTHFGSLFMFPLTKLFIYRDKIAPENSQYCWNSLVKDRVSVNKVT